MSQTDQNINNEDMTDCDLIDVESLDFSDDQTWLYLLPGDTGKKVDILDWNLSCEWPVDNDGDYLKDESKLYETLDLLLQNDISAQARQKFDSRTFVRPKKRYQRPTIYNMVDAAHTSRLQTIPQSVTVNSSTDKYLTYNKYNAPSPMLRLKTFNVDTNSDNSDVAKVFASKRRSLVADDDPQLEDADATLVSNSSERLSSENLPSKPINIDLSQPAHNLHNTFNKGLSNPLNERNSLNMYQSGESLMRMSPPSLVSSIQMENSGSFHPDAIENIRKDPAPPATGRESIDPMLNSMTLSILDEKDMSTSFLSQTTYPDHDSLMDSLPPSLVNSVNSSYIVPNPKVKTESETNIFSSATFTHLEQSEKLLSARPRMHNSYKRDSTVRNSLSYIKSREEACQINTIDKENEKISPEMGDTITLHYNDKYKKDVDSEKENLNISFEKDDAFYRDMGINKSEPGKNSLNVTMDKLELNEIIQARQKLSLARKALPAEEKPVLPNQADPPPIKTIQLPNQTITVPQHTMENVSELLSRRRVLNSNGVDKEKTVQRESPKRNATFKKISPKSSNMDATLVFINPAENNVIDINSATMNLVDDERTLQQEEWTPDQCAMVGSNESTDTGTFSSSSPPDCLSEKELDKPQSVLGSLLKSVTQRFGDLFSSSLTTANKPPPDINIGAQQIASTPIMAIRKSSKNNLMNIHNTISPIFDNSLDGTQIKCSSERKFQMPTNPIVINTMTLVKKSPPKREVLARSDTPDTIASPSSSLSLNAPVDQPASLPRKTGLPTSKLRMYSSHRELNRISATTTLQHNARAISVTRGSMSRRSVYASNPVLSPPSAVPPSVPSFTQNKRGSTFTPAPLVRQGTETLCRQRSSRSVRDEQSHAPTPVSSKTSTTTPALVRQGTETLRRDRPLSHLVAPKDLRVGPLNAPAPHITVPRSYNHLPVPTSRPNSVSGASQLRVGRPMSSGPVTKQSANITTERPSSANDQKQSALPRPSRLPAPRRALRPPSVYSVAQTGGDYENY